VDEVFRVIEQINREGVTVLVVEQNVAHALKSCNRAYILEIGRATLQGTGKELLGNEYVKEAYLGI
jgi:branched-chain amino acid transport system ATP-binding protein